MKNKLRLGFAQFPLILGLLIMAIAVPVATRLVEENQDTRNRAASEIDPPLVPPEDPAKKGCGQLCLNDGECISGFCNADVGRCRNNLCPDVFNCICLSLTPSLTPTLTPTATATLTPTSTATMTPTVTSTPTFTPTPTNSLAPAAGTPTATPTGPAVPLANPAVSISCSGNGATLTWQQVTGADFYAIRIDNMANGWNNTCSAYDPAKPDTTLFMGDSCAVNNGIGSISYTITNVTQGQQYQVWVHAMSNAFRNDWRSFSGFKRFTCNTSGLVTPRLYFASDPLVSSDRSNLSFSYDYNGRNTASQKMVLDFYWRVKGTSAWTRMNESPLKRNGFDFGRTSMTKALVAENLGKVYEVAIEAVVFNDTVVSNGLLDNGEVFKRCSGREGMTTASDCEPDNKREVSIPAAGTTLTPTATTTTAPGLAKQACCGACSATNSRISATYDVGTTTLTATFLLAENQNEAGVTYSIECFYNDGGNEVRSMGVGTTSVSGTTTTVTCTKVLPDTVGFNGNIYVYAKITTSKGTSTAVCDGTNGTCVSCGQKTATIVGAPTATTTPVTCKPSLVAPVSGNRVDSPVTLKWNNNCGDANSRYVVNWWEDATGGVTNCSGALGAGVVEKVVTLYEANKKYSWMVRKCSTWNCQEGCETGAVGQYLPWSDVRSFTINTPSDLPFTPTPTPTLDPAEACRIESVSCGPVTVDSVKLNLTYNQVVNSRIAGLKIQRNADIAMTLPANATVAQVGDTGLTASTTYSYKAYCYGADGATFTHTVKSVDCRTADTPIGQGCPNCPTVTSEIVARNDGKYNVKLSWPASTNATGYQIWRNKMDGSGTDMGFARVVENQAGLVWIDDNDGLGYEIAKDVQYKVLPLKASSDCGVPSGCTVEEVRVTVVGPGPGGACANECPSSFKCYRKGTTGNDYRWFADGYVGAGYTVQAGVTTAAGCGNVAVPTFQGKRKGDANCDGKINLEDASSWRKEYVEGDTGTVTKNNWLADFNCDQKVGTADRSIWRDSYSSMQ